MGVLYNNFTAGELSRLVDGRTDLPGYYNGCRLLQGFVPLIQGGATRAPGTKYIATTKGNGVARVQRFVYAKTAAYVLEFGNQYMRVYTDGEQVTDAGSPYEIVTPYAAADLFELVFVPSWDRMYIFHGDYEPRVLTCAGDTSWTLAACDFTYGPFRTENTTATTITPSATSGSITLTASASVFDDSHVGALFELTHWVDEYFVDELFSGVAIGADTPYVKGTWDISVWAWMNGFVGTVKLQKSYDGTVWHDVRIYTVSLSYTMEETDQGEEEDDNVRYRLNCTAWTSGQCIVWFRIHGHHHTGIVEITAVTSPTVATATVINELGGTDATTKWSEGAWSDVRGWPAVGAFYEQRLWAGSTEAQPQTLWATRTYAQAGDYGSMQTGADDSDALAYTINSNEMNAMRWMVPSDFLLIGTEGDTWKVSATNEKDPVTPHNIAIRPQNAEGSAAFQAIKIANAVVYVGRGARKVYELRLEQGDIYEADDLTRWAEHITESGIVDWAYQAQPHPILWAIREDGNLINLSYYRKDNVLGWGWRPFDVGGSVSEEGLVITEEEGEAEELPAYIWVMPGRGLTRYNSDWTSGGGFGADQETLHQLAVNTDGEVLWTGNPVAAWTPASPSTCFYVDADWNRSDLKPYDGTKGWVPVADQAATASNKVTACGWDSTNTYAYVGVHSNRYLPDLDVMLIYKIEVATGTVMWRYEQAFAAYYTSRIRVDSDDNVYFVCNGSGVDTIVIKVDADGDLDDTFTYEDEVNLNDIWIDEDLGCLLACGNYSDDGGASYTYYINWRSLTNSADTGTTVTPADAKLSYGWSRGFMCVRVYDEIIYACGTRYYTDQVNRYGVVAYDADGNFVAGYDPGDPTYLPFANWANRCVGMSTTADGTLVVAVKDDDELRELSLSDLTLVASHSYSPDTTALTWGDDIFAFGTEQMLESETTTTITDYSQSSLGPNSVTTIPGDSEDEVWLVVSRYIDGSVVRYVEQQQPFDWGTSQRDCWFVDSGVKWDGGAAVYVTGIVVSDGNGRVTVQAPAHGFTDGWTVRFSDIGGMTELNAHTYLVADGATNTFILKKVDGTYVDGSAFTEYASGGTVERVATTLSGLTHLEGEEVAVLGDGRKLGSETVSSGAITIDEYCNTIIAGLPYTSQMQPMWPESKYGAYGGTTIQGKPQKVTNVRMRFYKSLGGKMGTDSDDAKDIEYYTHATLEKPMPILTGDSVVIAHPGGWQNNGSIHIETNDPLPMTVCSIIYDLEASR